MARKRLSTRDRVRCTAAVWKRDCYRRTGRGPSGFSMHYSKEQCAREAVEGSDLCWQHLAKEDGGVSIVRAQYWKHVGDP